MGRKAGKRDARLGAGVAYPAFSGTPRVSVPAGQRRGRWFSRHADGGLVLPGRFRLWVLRRAVVSRTVDEVALLRAARGHEPGVTYEQLDAERMSALVDAHGIDLATAVLYDRIRGSESHGAFVRAVDDIDPASATLPQIGGTMLVAPASLYEELPEYGGDGVLVRQVAEACGMRTRLVATPGMGGVHESADIFRRALAETIECDEGPIVIVSMSKGSSDVRLALEASGAPFAGHVVWLNICGLVRGSYLLADLANPTNLRGRMLLKQYSMLGLPRQSILDLGRGPGTALDHPLAAPAGVTTISVVALPLTHHLTRSLRSRHARLARYGPNDGSAVALDTIVEPGSVYPVLGVDHYFRSPQVVRVLYQLFAWIGSEHGPLRTHGSAGAAIEPARSPAAALSAGLEQIRRTVGKQP